MSKSALLAIDAGTLFTPVQKFSPGRLIIDGTSVADAGPADTIRIPSGAERVDASQVLVTPGFIEPHMHGCGGVDVMDGCRGTEQHRFWRQLFRLRRRF